VSGNLAQRQQWLKAVHYVLTKLSGAGLSLSVFFTYILLLSKCDMYKFVEEISKPLFWIVFYGYGMVCSLLIDLLALSIRKVNATIKILLYIIAGYAFFIVKEVNAFTLIAGTIGALCALLFYFGTFASQKTCYVKYGFAIVLPLLFILLSTFDFTIKKQWTEMQSGSAYKASFEYFNGKHEIPVYAEKNQTIAFSIRVANMNGGGHGFHVLNDKDRLVGMHEDSSGFMNIHVAESGIYRIVVTGDDLKGSFEVTWNIR
jgi:hypothetical protein